MENAINKIVSDKALGEVERLIVALDSAEKRLDSVIQTAGEFNKALSVPPKSSDALNKQLAESDRLIKQLQIDYKAHEATISSLQKKIEQLSATKKTATATDRQTIIDNREIRKELDGQAIANSNLTSYIQKLSVERAKASRIVADYNAMQKMEIELTQAQADELAQATASFQKYDNAIKAGKKSIGDAREYVGQYERANLGLINSVNQIVREVPSATFGIQTFFLAISNNVPIMVDEVKRAVEVNKQLSQSGEKITPVWKQVSNAIFSFNTFLNVGLLLLALYGKEIGEATAKIFGFGDALGNAKKELDLLNQQTDEFNNLSVEAVISYEKQYNKLKQLIAVMKDERKGDLDRKSAKQEILSLYPGYFKSMSDEQKLLSNLKDNTSTYSQALSKLTADIKKRAEAEAKAKTASETLKLSAEMDKEVQLREKVNNKYLDLWSKYGDGEERLTKRERKEITDQIANRKELLDEDSSFVEKFGKIAIPDSGSISIIGTYATSQIESIKQKSKELKEEYKKQQEEVNSLFVETSLLDVKDTKNKEDNTRAIKLNTKAREDYLASEYELWKLRKTNESNRNKEIMNDEASGYELRLMASEQYYQNQLDLANREAQEELRVLEFSFKEQQRIAENEYINYQDSLNKKLADDKTSASQRALILKELSEISKQYDKDKTAMVKDNVNKQNIIYENQAQKLINANKEMIGVMERAWDEINFGKAVNEIENVSLNKIKELNKELSGINIGSEEPEVIQAKLDKIANMTKEASNDINKREAQLALDRAERTKKRIIEETIAIGVARGLSKEQINENIKNNLSLLNAEDNIIKAKKEVAKADTETANTEIENAKKVLEKRKQIYLEIKDRASELYSALQGLAGQLFENQINDYDRQIKKSNEYYDKLIENSEKGSEQEKLLQEEKAKREEVLQKRKIELQRKQAIFNKLLQVAEIVSSTASAVAKIQLEASVLRANPLTAPLATLALSQIPMALATSAVQIATVMATPLPQYKDGRGKGKDEYAIVGDGGRSEVIERGNGKFEVTPSTPTLTHLGKDDIVHKSLEDFKNSKIAIQNASIMASFGNQNRQLQMFDYYLSRELNGISNKIEKGIENGFKKAKINNYVNMPKIDIGHLQYKNKGFNA